MLATWHLWVMAGILLWIIEIFTPGFVLGLFGAACLVTAPFAASGVPFRFQLIIFAAATATMALWIRPLALRLLHRRGAKVRTNADALVGRAGLVTEGIDRDRRTGQVRIGGETWSAAPVGEPRIEAGCRVVVRRIEGNRVVVERETT